MTAKNEQLYTAVIAAVRDYIPEFNPSIVMCDFEKASRNAFISLFPYANIVGCWFHFTKALYEKVQKLGLGKLYQVNKEFKNWIHLLMSLPFLPEEEIRPTYLAIHLPFIGLTESELQMCATFKSNFSKVWIEASVGISVFYYEFNTNNGAESYHNCLNSYIKTNHPNVWKFMLALQSVMADYDLELGRLDNGLEITRAPKKKTILNVQQRTEY